MIVLSLSIFPRVENREMVGSARSLQDLETEVTCHGFACFGIGSKQVDGLICCRWFDLYIGDGEDRRIVLGVGYLCHREYQRQESKQLPQ